MTLHEIESASDAYAAELEAFTDYYRLPEEWFGTSDHVAVKCRDRTGFEQQVDEIREHADEVLAVDMDGRTLATARLTSRLAVGSLREVKLLEIMEPRPEKVSKGLVGFEHMEFTFPDLGLVMSYLEQVKASYEYQENPGHRWVTLVINNTGQELKINDRSLADILEIEQAENRNYTI